MFLNPELDIVKIIPNVELERKGKCLKTTAS